MTKYYTIHKDNDIIQSEIDASGYSTPEPIPIMLTDTEVKSGFSFLPISVKYENLYGGYIKYEKSELATVIANIRLGGVVRTKPRTEVNSSSISESSVVSKDSGNTFLWTSSYSADTGDIVFYLKNDCTNPLVIDKVTVNSALESFFELYLVTGTASGTTVSACSVNRMIINTAMSVAKGEAAVTGLTLGARIDLARTGTNGRATMELQDVIILGRDDAIAIKYTGDTGYADTITTGYYREC